MNSKNYLEFSHEAGDFSLREIDLENGTIKVSVQFNGTHCKKINILSESDDDILILNAFDSDLIAVSDKIPIDKFDAFAQRVQNCERGGYIKVKLAKGGDFTVIGVD